MIRKTEVETGVVGSDTKSYFDVILHGDHEFGVFRSILAMVYSGDPMTTAEGFWVPQEK